MIYSVVQRDQFSRQGRRLLCVARRAERAFLQADLFQRRIAKRFKSCSLHRQAPNASGKEEPCRTQGQLSDQAEGQAFLAMAYLDGSTVREKIKERPLTAPHTAASFRRSAA